MDTQTLLARPKPKEQPKIVAKMTKIGALTEVSTEARKTSLKLRKTFEKGIYQRKTQLSVLNRYKKRLDSIQKEQDKKIAKQSKKKPSLQIPKFSGSFFTKGAASDPLKAIGALAAFKALERMFDGDILGGIMGPGMVAAASLLGPGLLGAAGGAMDGAFSRRARPTRGFDVTGRRVSTPTQERYLRRYGDKAFKSRFGGDALKRTRQGSEVVSNVGKGGRVAKAFGRFGAAIIPGVGAVVGAADAALRAQSGDQFGAALSGTAAAFDAYAAASAATGVGLPAAGLLSIASFALDATNLIRDLTGMSAKEEEKNKKIDKKLEKKKKEQKELAKSKSNLTFAKTLVSYESALIKFEKFSKQFSGSRTPEQQKAEDQRQAAQIENSGAGGTPISGAGYEFTNNISQYLTGDPNSPAYDYAHGTTSNYHDHLAFKDRGTAERAYKFLKGKGLQVTEFKGYDRVGGHSSGSAHYDGLAFDVPGGQWGGSGAIGQKEYSGSAKVRAFMNDFFQLEKSRQQQAPQGSNDGGVLSGPKDGYPAILHGTEAVIPIDNYHTVSGGDPLKNISPEIINNISARSRVYQTAVSNLPPEIIRVPIPISPPQIQYVSTGSASLNIQSDADGKVLKMLYYSALG